MQSIEKQYDLSFKMSPFYNNDNNNHFYPPFPYQNFSKLHAWRILFYIFNEFFNAVAISKRYRFNRKIPIEKKISNRIDHDALIPNDSFIISRTCLCK